VTPVVTGADPGWQPSPPSRDDGTRDGAYPQGLRPGRVRVDRTITAATGSPARPPAAEHGP